MDSRLSLADCGGEVGDGGVSVLDLLGVLLALAHAKR